MPDGLKRPRMLLRLDAAIVASNTALEAGCRRGERAAYLARLARFDEARAEIADLQQRFAALPQAETSIWIQFAQGLLAYYENLGVCRTDHVRRAHAIAVASGHTQLRALCAAWLALWDFSRLDMPALVGHLREALALADPQQHAALARAGLVAAQALHAAGRPDLARHWYQLARHHATIDGDDATLSALMHNMAWARLALLRQAVMTGVTSGGVEPDLTGSLQSSVQFDERLGGALWPGLRSLLRAQALSLQGDPAGALVFYDAHSAEDPSSPGSMLPRLQGPLIADRAWCLHAIGRVAEARAGAALAAQRLSDDTQVDDLAATHSRLAQLHAALGDSPLAQQHETAAARAWNEHALAQARTLELMTGIAPGATQPSLG